MKFNAVGVFAASVMINGALAALQITFPNSNVWWVANSVNLISWTCQDNTGPSSFTVVVYGPGTLTNGLPILGILQNYQCSINVPPNGDITAGSGYKVAFTNVLNRSDILIESSSFDVKAQGSPYPPEPSNNASQPSTSSGASSSGTATSSSPSQSTTSKKPNAASVSSPMPLSFSAAFALVFGALFA